MAATEAGLKIPQDLSLLMIGHGGLYSPLFLVDTMTVPFQDIGRCAVQQLLRKIEKPDVLLPTRVLPTYFDLCDTSAPLSQPTLQEHEEISG
jgi:DNA-binding LacI/PurR family transcriptional regulator